MKSKTPDVNEVFEHPSCFEWTRRANVSYGSVAHGFGTLVRKQLCEQQKLVKMAKLVSRLASRSKTDAAASLYTLHESSPEHVLMRLEKFLSSPRG